MDTPLTTNTEAKLWGHLIQPTGSSVPLALQAAACLRREIEGGRWNVGELLPAPRVLAQSSGLAMSVFSRAYENLAAEGYIERVKRKGSILRSRHPIPKAREPQFTKLRGGPIGLLIWNPRNSGTFRSADFLEHLISTGLDRIRFHGRESDVVTLDSMSTDGGSLRVEELFDREPVAVLCIGPVPKLTSERGPVPQLYIHRTAHACRPQVIGDYLMAVQMMTRRALDAGHRNLLCFGDPALGYDSEIRWLCHRREVERAGLKANEAGFRSSLELDAQDPGQLAELLRAYPEATCLISLERVSIGQCLVAAAERIGRSVPADLSVLSYGSETVYHLGNRLALSGVDHDIEALLRISVDRLVAMTENRDTAVVSTQIEAVEVRGNTFAPPVLPPYDEC